MTGIFSSRKHPHVFAGFSAALLASALQIVSLVQPLPALAGETGVFPSPIVVNDTEIVFVGEMFTLGNALWHDKSTPEDGIKETLMRLFNSPYDNKFIIQYVSAHGETYQWAIYHNWVRPSKNDQTQNYVIIDTNGDGIFDLKIRTDTVSGVPDWAEQNSGANQ